MKTTSIYTLFFSPTGTSRKIAAAVAQGMTETEGTATEESAGHNADAAQAPSSGQVPGAGSAAAAAPEPAAGNRGETKSMHGEPTVTAIDLTHPAGYPAPLPGEAVAIFAVPVYGGHVAPAALERLREIRGEGTPAVVLAVYGNRSFGTAVAELASFVAGRGFVPVAAGAFVGEHSYSTPETPIAQGRPDARDLAAATAFGAQVREKLAKTRPSPAGTRKRHPTPQQPPGQPKPAAWMQPRPPQRAPLSPSTPRNCANRVRRSSRSCASSGSYWDTAAGRNATPSSCCPREMPHAARNAAAASHCAPRRPSHAATSCTPTRHAASAAAPA